MSTKFYSAKSKATRALRDTFKIADEATINSLLIQSEDGRWGFDCVEADMAGTAIPFDDDGADDAVAADSQNIATAFAQANGLEVVALVADGVVAEDANGVRTVIHADEIAPLAPATTTAPTIATVTASVVAKKISAKNHIRALMSTGNRYTMAELLYNSRYSESNIRTALSDLKNKLYADGETLIVKRTRVDGIDYYSL